MTDTAKPCVLVVDDAPENIRVTIEALKDHYAILPAKDGEKALRLASREGRQPDIILLDVVMPDMDGYAVCRALKADPATRDIPVIFVTSLSEASDETLGLALGAVDYIAKPFNQAILKARIANHLALRQAYRELQRSQRVIAEDLTKAADYVISLLPPELTDGPVKARWRFIPTSSLGGDALGYHFPDPEHFAFYLLDVCSHGVGPALLSVQALNVLRNQSMPGVDFLDPAEVLAKLNDIFRMDRHNNLYFTIIYGVYDLRSRGLALATAGHPPPLLFTGDQAARALKTPNLMIGAMPGVVYKSQQLVLEPGSQLYLFSDGVYEVRTPAGPYWTYEEFKGYMSDIHARLGAGSGDREVIDAVLAHAREWNGNDMLDDDFSMLRLVFP